MRDLLHSVKLLLAAALFLGFAFYAAPARAAVHSAMIVVDGREMMVSDGQTVYVTKCSEVIVTAISYCACIEVGPISVSSKGGSCDHNQIYQHTRPNPDPTANPICWGNTVLRRTRIKDFKPDGNTDLVVTVSTSVGSLDTMWANANVTFKLVVPKGCACIAGADGPQNVFGNGGGDVGSIHFGVGLGRAQLTSSHVDASAGHLSISAEAVSTALATPSALEVISVAAGVSVVPNVGTGFIHQVRTLDGLVQVVVHNGYKYSLVFYANQFVGAVDSNGYYTLIGSPSPIVTWTVENPDASPTVYNRLWIKESRIGLDDRFFKFDYNATNLRWELLLPDGETTKAVWKVVDGADPNVTTYYEEFIKGGVVLSHRHEKKKYVAAVGKELLQEVVEGTGGLAETTTYTYYSGAAAQGSQNELQRVDYPGGNWEFFVYDSYGRVTTKYSAWLDNAPPSPGTTPVPTTIGCKVTEYAYALVDATDGIDSPSDTYPKFSPVKTVVKIPVPDTGGYSLKTVKRSMIYSAAGDTSASAVSEEVSDPANSSIKYGALSNMRRETVYHSKTGDFTDGKINYVVEDNGDTTTYYYTLGSSDYTEARIRTSYDSADTQTEEIVKDLKGRVVSIIKKANSGYGDVILQNDQYAYSSSDPRGLDHTITHLDGTTTVNVYSCCGQEYTIDREGVKHIYYYDPFRRLAREDRLEGTTYVGGVTNAMDALGRLIFTQRIPISGSAVVQSRQSYDVLGRLVYSTNALGGVTTNLYEMVSNRRRNITLFPDGSGTTNLFFGDGRLKKTWGLGGPQVEYTYGADDSISTGVWREYSKATRLNTSFASTDEWSSEYVNGLGNTIMTVWPKSGGTVSSPRSYDDSGRLTKVTDADGVRTLFKYVGFFERSSGVDVDWNDATPESGLDRLTQTKTRYLPAAYTDYNEDVVATETSVWNQNNDGTPFLIRSEIVSANGLKMWSVFHGDSSTWVTNSSAKVYGGSGGSSLTRTAPDGSYAVTSYSYGRPTMVIQRDSGHNIIGQNSFGYNDPFKRRSSVTDARNGASYYIYNNADLVATNLTSVPGPDQAAQATITHHDTSLRPWRIVQPDGSSVTNVYFPGGQLKKTYGSRTYPVEYIYDAQRRMTTMKTWQDFVGDSGIATTTWNYDTYRGWLANKRDNGAKGADYTYTAAGRLKTRQWARIGTSSQRITTTYTYGVESDGISNNQHGDLVGVAYTYDPASTPSLTYTYDRAGRRRTVLQNGTTTTLTYSEGGLPLTESYSGGILSTMSVSREYDDYLRPESTAVLKNSVSQHAVGYAYDLASRLSTVTSGSDVATYGYVANSPLVGQIQFREGGTLRLTTAKNYDFINRATLVSHTPSGAGAVVHSYGYNDANQRVRITEADGSYWNYAYDSLGQVASGRKFWSDGSPVAGRQFVYGFDDIGNRTGTWAGGDGNGLNARYADYDVNLENEYTARDIPAAIDVTGVALANSAVTVNGLGTYRKGEYFWKELPVANSSVPVWQNVLVEASGLTTVQGNVYVPKNREVFVHDDDGNLTSDGRWNYTWNAENQLIKLESISSVPSGIKRQILFTYDWQGRRTSKVQKVWNVATSVYDWYNEFRYVYDGWNLLAALNQSLNQHQYYVWGTDLSGSMQGAGGVGGLLFIKTASSGNHCVAPDANGNIVALIKASDGTVSARYEYGPFGEAIASTGTMAAANPFRFSTKFQDDESELYYYGYRYYNVSKGSWINRDPIGEQGGINLLRFFGNNPISSFDALGLDISSYDRTYAAQVAWLFMPYYGFATFRFTSDDEACTVTVSGPKLTGYTKVLSNTLSAEAELKSVKTIELYGVKYKEYTHTITVYLTISLKVWDVGPWEEKYVALQADEVTRVQCRGECAEAGN